MKTKRLFTLATIMVATAAHCYDLSSAFLSKSNPSGPWSFGSEATLNGPFSLFTVHDAINEDSGGIWEYWYYALSTPPSIYRNSGTATVTSDSGEGTFTPGTVWFGPGAGAEPAFCVVRFTVPPGEAGEYHIASAVRPYLDGASSRDADFHVSINGNEIYGALVQPGGGAGFTNAVMLKAGDTVDFLVGRGSDDSPDGGSLKIVATVTRQGSFAMRAGDSIDWHFSSLAETQSYGGLSVPDLGGVNVFLDSGSFAPGTSLLVEMFESNTLGSPIGSRIVSEPTNVVRLVRESAWADHEGAVRVSVIIGSAALFSVAAYTENVTDGGVTENRSRLFLSEATPALAAAQTSSGIQLKWSATPGGTSQLMVADAIGNDNWATFLPALPDGGTGRRQHFVTVPATNGARFFRLSN